MKFSTTAFTLSLLTAIRYVFADSDKFNAMTLRTGTDLQYGTIVENNGVLSLGKSEDKKTSVVTDSGAWKFGDKYVKVTDNGSMDLVEDVNQATKEFAVKGGYLVYNNGGYSAVKNSDNNGYSLRAGVVSEANVTPFAIRPNKENGNRAIPDFVPGSQSSQSGSSTSTQSSSSSASTTTNSGSAKSTTSGHESVSTVPSHTSFQPVSQTTDGQVQAGTESPGIQFQSDNAAAKAAPFGALFAIGALLL